MILEKVPRSLRGALTRWLIEVRAGIFVGNPTQRVREELWKKVMNPRRRQPLGYVLQLWSAPNAQGYDFRQYGESKRQLIDFEGLGLVTLVDKVPF
jgi:CRISPR-associated protein Cas2